MKPLPSVKLHRAGVTRTSFLLFAEDKESYFAQADVVSQPCRDRHTSPQQSCLHCLVHGGKKWRGTYPKRMLCQLHHRSASASAEKGREHFCSPVPRFLSRSNSEGESWMGAEFASRELAAGGDAHHPQHRACKVCKAQQATGAWAEPISHSSAA